MHYTTLHYITLYCTALHYNAPHNTTLYCTALHYNAPHYTTLHHTTLHYIALHYTIMHHTTLQHCRTRAVKCPRLPSLGRSPDRLLCLGQKWAATPPGPRHTRLHDIKLWYEVFFWVTVKISASDSRLKFVKLKWLGELWSNFGDCGISVSVQGNFWQIFDGRWEETKTGFCSWGYSKSCGWHKHLYTIFIAVGNKICYINPYCHTIYFATKQ